METLIEAIDKYYQKEILPQKNEQMEGDSLFSISISDLGKKIGYKKEDDNVSLGVFKENNLNVDEIIHIINNSESQKNIFFSKDLYKTIPPEKFNELIKKCEVPSKYLKKVIKYILSKKTNQEKTLMNFININVSSFTEDIIIYIIKQTKQLSNYNSIIKQIIENVAIDIDYFLQLVKEDESNILEQNEIKSVIECFVKKVEISEYGWDKLLQSLLLFSLLKKIISNDYYDKTIKEIKQKEKRKENEDYIKDIDINLINKISNNKSIIREQILI